ncbi:MAG: hypothetical protein AUK48_14845 [Oscillatoriales cyanobacterium CG2_30_44_21]|nr:MAG: hypothetical protein AUK48_14845 [Oscillatoriales cyanobacterium CG2_30_44_21]
MGIINSMFAKLKSNSQVNNPDIQVVPSQAPPAPVPQANSAMQRYTEIEAELAPAPQTLQAKAVKQINPTNTLKKLGNRLLWAGILVGVPVGIIYVVNLPYPVIRQPVSKVAPILLLPSNMSIDANYKKGQATVEESRQLIESPTSAADLDRGELQLREGKAALDSIPAWYVAEWSDYSRGYSWGYDWRFTPAGLQSTRIKAGELEAKVFQEKNALIALTDAEKDLAIAKAVFQKATKPIDKKVAVQDWRAAIDRIEQIPEQTLAGRKAKQLAINASRDLQELGGLAAGNQKIVALISGAEEFAKKAAESGRNPPYSSDRWAETAAMWQEAVDRLEKIPNEELQGYTEIQAKLASYRVNLSEVKIRLKNETDSVQAFERSNQKLSSLWATLPKSGKDLNPNQVKGKFLEISAELDKVKSGTTVYLKAQEIKLEVRNQLKLLERAK